MPNALGCIEVNYNVQHNVGAIIYTEKLKVYIEQMGDVPEFDDRFTPRTVDMRGSSQPQTLPL